MSMASKSAVVSSGIAIDVEEIVNAIRAAAEQQGRSADEAIRILRPQGKDMLPGATEALILLVGAASWFSKKWFDTFVWPKIAEPIRKPSEQAVDLVLRFVSTGADTKGHPDG
jgi:hypothetical protein